MRCLLMQRRGRPSGAEQPVLARSLLRCSSFGWARSGLIARTTIDLVDRGQPAALADRRCERPRHEPRDTAHRDRDGVQADRRSDLEQLGPDRPLGGHRRRQDRDDQADRQRRKRRVRAPGEGKAPERGRPASRVQAMSKTRERDGRVPGCRAVCRKDTLVSSPPFRVVRRRGGAAARRPGRSARPRSRTGPRIRSTGSAHARCPADCPQGPRRRWTAGSASP